MTTFSATRPWLMWSTEAKRRARLNGSLKVVEAVPIKPTCSVTAASAVSSTVGSRDWNGCSGAGPDNATPSERKTASKVPRSAIRAMSWKNSTWTKDAGSSSTRQPPG